MKRVFVIIAITLISEIQAKCSLDKLFSLLILFDPCDFVNAEHTSLELALSKKAKYYLNCVDSTSDQQTRVTSITVKELCHPETNRKSQGVIYGIHFCFENVRKLDLSNNCIANLVLPANWTSLETINLENNNLSKLDGLTQEDYPNLKNLHIKGNPFGCEYLEGLKCNNLEIYHDCNSYVTTASTNLPELTTEHYEYVQFQIWVI